MILSMAHAEITEADRENLFGEWSNLRVGEQPEGLVSAYLLTEGDVVRVAAVWHSVEAHDRALGDEKSHPAFKVFEAAGADPHHAVMDVVGSIT